MSVQAMWLNFKIADTCCRSIGARSPVWKGRTLQTTVFKLVCF